MKWLFTKDERINSKNKQILQQQEIVQMLSKSERPLTIDEIRKALRISTPTGIKLTNELVESGIVRTEGKKETDNGRKPALYTLNDVNLYALSVEILMNKITVSLIDLHLNVVNYKQDREFILENTNACLNRVVQFIRKSMEDFGISHDYLLGIGAGITGRINTETGESLSYFAWLKPSLKKFLTEEFDLPVFVDNDTRCLGLAEKKIGDSRDVKNAVIINLGQGLGTSLIVENEIVKGSNGFAGEFGHMQFDNNDKMCICGKRGCLGNVVSGYALEEKFREAIEAGGLSLLTEEMDVAAVRHQHILNAALRGDSLSIELLQEMGQQLGRALGNIINLLNPEQVIIGGNFANAENLLGDSIKLGMATSALINPLKNCSIAFSKLGELAGIQGAGSLVFTNFELI